MLATSGGQHLSRLMAEFVATTTYQQLDAETTRSSRFALLDGLGVSIAASTLGEGVTTFVDWVRLQEAKPRCSVIGQNFRTSASLAALANGALAHALDYEDAHDKALVHPNAAVIPAALAIAQTLEKPTGEGLVTAIAVGCEIVCRLGLAISVPLDNYSWYPPPILSAYGATAAAASLLKLTPQQVLDAFSLTSLQATCSGEIKHNPHSEIRAIRDAFPAQAAVMAAQLAQLGVKGFEQPFEGKDGFFAAYARNQFDPDAVLNNLGEQFEISKVSFKPWPSCRGTHTAIDLVLNMMQEHGLNKEDIESVTIFGNQINRMLAEPRASKRRPNTAIDAKFSLPFCVATALVNRRVDLDSFNVAGLCNVEVLNMANRVNYLVDDGLQHMLTTRVELSLSDGRCISEQASTAYGCPERPLSESDLIKKFERCLGYSTKAAHRESAKAIAATVLTVEQSNLATHLFDYL